MPHDDVGLRVCLKLKLNQAYSAQAMGHHWITASAVIHMVTGSTSARHRVFFGSNSEQSGTRMTSRWGPWGLRAYKPDKPPSGRSQPALAGEGQGVFAFCSQPSCNNQPRARLARSKLKLSLQQSSSSKPSSKSPAAQIQSCFRQGKLGSVFIRPLAAPAVFPFFC